MSRRVVHLGMNFIKMVKDLYSENYNTLMKKLKEVLRKLKAIPSSCTDRNNMVQICVIPKPVYRLNVVPVKI